jgi:hypothetical protein
MWPQADESKRVGVMEAKVACISETVKFPRISTRFGKPNGGSMQGALIEFKQVIGSMHTFSLVIFVLVPGFFYLKLVAIFTLYFLGNFCFGIWLFYLKLVAIFSLYFLGVWVQVGDPSIRRVWFAHDSWVSLASLQNENSIQMALLKLFLMWVHII